MASNEGATLKIYISVTNKKKRNDLQKSIATGLFYVHSEFDALSSLVSGEVWNSNPLGLRPLQSWNGKYVEHQNRLYREK